MKLFTVLALVVFANGAFAISAFEKKNKEEMSARTETILSKVESARLHAKKDEAIEACAEIAELVTIYPDHLKSIGMHMNNNKTKVMVARDQALNQLIFFHRQSTVCNRGENSEYVDAKDLQKKLKKIEDSLKKQKRLIEKEHTNFENDFYYHYEF